jgi:Ca2+-binding RTX toxin-like protein
MANITGTEGPDNITGTAQADVIKTLGGFDTVDAGAGDDVIEGGAGGGSFAGGPGNDSLTGGIDGETLNGGAGDDVIRGGGGNDQLQELEGGNDQLFGEDGDDNIFVSRALGFLGTLVLDGGAGNDTIQVQSYSTAAATVAGGSGNDTIVLITGANIDTGAGEDRIRLHQLLNPFGFNQPPIVVTGFQTGGGGDVIDVLPMLASKSNWNGSENPFATGHLRLAQSGNDTVLLLDLDGGADSLANLVTFTSVGQGSFTSTNFDGFTPGTTVQGSAAGDSLSGSAGADTLSGGLGDDTYLVDDASDVIVEAANAGTDQVRTTLPSYALAAEVEQLIFLGTSTFGGIGNAAHNTIAGGIKNDALFGHGGNDLLIGGLGADQLYGGDGDDALEGGAGADIIDGGAGTDLLILSGSLSDYTVVANGNGTFRLISTSTDTVSGIEQVRLGGTTLSWTDFSAQAFNGLRYIASYGDLIAAFGGNAAAGAEHFRIQGVKEGRDPGLFDPLRYAASNPDLAQAFGANADALALHYIAHGVREGRSTTSFDPFRYAASNTDLIAVFGGDAEALTVHYIVHGLREGRSATSFDALQYAAANTDLAQAFGGSVHDLTVHYVAYGAAEGRATTFDAINYAAANPDLARAFGGDPHALAVHYVAHGLREGRPTSGFDAVGYLLSNADLAQAGLGVDGARVHWVAYGAREGRSGDALFGREQLDHGIDVGETLTGVLTTGDRDWYQVTLTGGQSFTIALDGAGSGAGTLADPHLSVHDASGKLLAYDFDSGPGLDATLTFTALRSGTYYVVSSSGADAGAGTYRLSLSLAPFPDLMPSTRPSVTPTAGSISLDNNRVIEATEVYLKTTAASHPFADGLLTGAALYDSNPKNYGTVWVDVSSGDANGYTGSNLGALTNYGLIVVETDAGVARGFGASSWGRLVNEGEIFVRGTSSAVGYLTWEPSGASQGRFHVNSGLFDVRASSGSATGIWLTNGGPVINTDDAILFVRGNSATGILISEYGGSVHNDGLIMAVATESFTPSTAIWGYFNQTVTDGSAHVVNNGTIRAGIAVKAMGSHSETILNRGLIVGDIDHGAGNDTLLNLGRIEGYTYMGSGDDLVDLRLATGSYAGTIDGGLGTDTLRIVDEAGVAVGPVHLDVGNLLENFERIELSGAGNTTLVIDLADVLGATDTNDRLSIAGSTGDRVDLDAGWAAQGSTVEGGVVYNIYTNGAATLLIHSEIALI